MGAAAARCLLLKPVLLPAAPRTPKSFRQPRLRTVDRIDCRLAVTPEGDAKQSSACATSAYLREGAIAPNAARQRSPTLMTISPNAPHFRALSRRRAREFDPHSRDIARARGLPELSVYSRICSIPSCAPASVIVDPTRFITNRVLSQLYPGPALRRHCGSAGSPPSISTQSISWSRSAPSIRHSTAALSCHRLICDARPLPAARKADQPDDGGRPRLSPIRSTTAIRSSVRHSSSAACCSSGICSPPCRRPRPSCRSTTTGRRFKVASDAPRTMPQKKARYEPGLLHLMLLLLVHAAVLANLIGRQRL